MPDLKLERRNFSWDFGLPDFQEPVHFSASSACEPEPLRLGLFARLPDSVTVSTTDFDSVCPGSNPGRVTPDLPPRLRMRSRFFFNGRLWLRIRPNTKKPRNLLQWRGLWISESEYDYFESPSSSFFFLPMTSGCVGAALASAAFESSDRGATTWTMIRSGAALMVTPSGRSTRSRTWID